MSGNYRKSLLDNQRLKYLAETPAKRQHNMDAHRIDVGHVVMAKEILWLRSKETLRERDDSVLIALVLRAAREIRDRRIRHALLADLLADYPSALDGLSAMEIERLRGNE